MADCEFVGAIIFEGFTGKQCKLDMGYCSLFGDVDLVPKCPVRKKFLASGISPSATPDLGYQGVKKAFRSGQFGTFNGGMPPEYLRNQGKQE